MHVLLFAYGTIRTDPADLSTMNLSDAEASDYGQLDIQLNWDPNAELIGDLGGWVLHDRAMFCDSHNGRLGIPAVSSWHEEDARVVGDLYKVTIDGFRNLLKYEGFPTLYDYEVLTVIGKSSGGVCRMEDAVVFTTSRADQFGDFIRTGDYFAPEHKEVRCAE